MTRGETMSRLLAAFVAGLTVFTHPVASQQQPLKKGVPGTHEIVGNSGVSAQQLFLGTLNKVYILDKTEANPLTINNHPAWAVEYDINTNQFRAMDVMSNTLCAAGNVLGDGEWVLAGGNLAVSPDGWWSPVQEAPGDPIYKDTDGGKAMRFIRPCDDQKCEWNDDPKRYMSTRRWYATIETLEGGDAFFVGGTTLGSFVNDNATADNPTYEFYPPRGNGQPIEMQFLKDTAPLNLYALTWLLPSGKLFLQANRKAMLFDYTTGKEDRLPDTPGPARTYPATGASVMMPLTPANNYAATIFICGGSDVQDNQWNVNWNIAQYPASASCVSMTPDASRTWQVEERLPIGRTMGNFILLPDQTIFLNNGGSTGVAGYAGDTWAVDDSYADHPVLTPSVYNPRAPAGKRWSSEGFTPSVVPRLYHSTATLLPDGSIFIAGSNPNSDFRNDPSMKYPTEYRTERFYPSYYSATRPEPKGLPANLTYGGPYFNVTLDAANAGPSSGFEDINVVVIRPGFATHALNMGQRLLQLQSTYTPNGDGSVTLHVSQMPPNAALFQPGPALLFVVVGGIPSVGVQVMVGSGKLEQQTMNPFVNLPPSPPSTKNASTTSGALSTAQMSVYLSLVAGVVSAVLSLL